jgi:hypothetical protein
MAEIPLHGKDGTVRAVAIVDEADVPKLDRWRWHLNPFGYAVRTTRSGPIFMHREILGLKKGDGLEGDHIKPGNPLDNRRANLRVVTRAQGAQNRRANRTAGRRRRTSRHRGVCFDRQTRRWRARVFVNGQNHCLGRFDEEKEAAAVAAAFRREHMPFSTI